MLRIAWAFDRYVTLPRASLGDSRSVEALLVLQASAKGDMDGDKTNLHGR